MEPESGEREQSRHDDERGARTTPERTQRERYGPLALERHAKDDGRALSLYERAEGDRA
jgi:hypothetical protein